MMASKEEIKLLDTYGEACKAYDATLKVAERATVALQKAYDRNTAAWAEHAAAEEVQLAAMGWIPDDEATRPIVELVEAKERFAHRAGYQVGEMERIALATANSELRSEIRCLKEEIRRLR